MQICTDCLDNLGVIEPAAVNAPIGNSQSFTYIPVCANHANGWYDGAEFTQADAPLQAIAGSE